jgi:23S rRNA (cytosine1962-C5)-methyltransferase
MRFPDFEKAWVVYQDEALLVVDKPAGVPSQAAHESHDDDLVSRLRRWLASERGVAPEQVYLGVHQRLDRDTSGLVMFTLQREANPAIAEQFAQRQIEKTYLALVETSVSARPGWFARLAHPPGRDAPARASTTLVHHLARARDGRMQVVSANTPNARAARTQVSVQRRIGERTLLELGCETGRTHQLRVQLAHEGAAIAGDRLYGRTPGMRLMLHAAGLSLCHPGDGRRLTFASPPPIEFEDWLVHGDRDVTDAAPLLRRALQLAVDRRYRLGRLREQPNPTSAFRLLHDVAEGSGRFAVELYGDFAVVHLFGEGIDSRCEQILDQVEALGVDGVYLKCHPKQKNDLADPRLARYAPSEPVRGRAAPDDLVVHEWGLPFGVRLGDGLRTGLFLDQRENRQRVRELASGMRVLNLFAYTGGFAVAALAGGAREAICIDASNSALAWGRRNVERIGAEARHRAWHADVFDALSQLGKRGESFDLIVLDPPSYSKTRSRRFVAAKDYAALCEACFRVLSRDGKLLACINHHGTAQAKLRRDVQQAARGAGRGLVQVKDIPPALDFPPRQAGEPSSKSVLVTCE